ncbi:Alkaline ceramidase tod1 [Ranunculus cassubicifolius]
MAKPYKTPLLFQSKLLCFSLFYLFTTLFLALYSTLSATKCIFRSSPFDPIQKPLFYYPSTYGEHKYAIPTLRSSCIAPLYFSEYWSVFREIYDILKNSSSPTSTLRYINTGSESFGGNLSTLDRISYFDRNDNEMKVPCGFMKELPISDYDRMSMESCRGVVVVSAIFGDHDKIRQPRGLGSKTLEVVCFFMFVDDHTFKVLSSHNLLKNDAEEHRLGAWRVVRVGGELPYESPSMNGVIPKHLVHRLFPNARYSIWLDAKIQLTVDPLLLIHSLIIKEDVDMAISKHPYYVHTMEEAMATARWKKWGDIGSLKMQMETYCEHGLQPWTHEKLPYPSDVPDTALIVRKHGVKSNLFSCLLFNELEAFNPRDQLAFAFVRDLMNPKLKMNMFEVEIFEQVVVEYRHNIKRGEENVASKLSVTKRARSNSPVRCQQYLLKMWGESHN